VSFQGKMTIWKFGTWFLAEEEVPSELEIQFRFLIKRSMATVIKKKHEVYTKR